MFKDLFVQLLQERNITAYKLSKDTGLSEALISNWKSGRQLPKYDSIKILCDYLEVSADYLLGRETSDTNIHNVADNHGIIGHAHAPVTIVNGNERRLSKQEAELLAIFEELSVVKQAKLLVYASELKKDE